MDIKGKRALVTGGATGIGRELCLRLADQGAQVLLLDINEADGRKTAEEHEALSYAFCDVSDRNQVTDVVDTAVAEGGPFHILVNNASIVNGSPLAAFTMKGVVTHDPALWDRMVGINLTGAFNLASCVVKHMIGTRTKGVVINVSSVCSGGNPGQGAYSATKAALEALAESWAKELSVLGIRAAAIAPGYTETETTMTSMAGKLLEDMRQRVPLRRLGRVEEIVEGILFIIQNDFFNARTLRLDGGLLI